MSLWKAARSCVFALMVSGVAPALAQDPEPVRLQRITGSVRIDGMPDEAAWQQIAPLPMTMYTPVFRGPPTQRTEIRIAYDDEYLYAAGWFYDTEPNGIRVNSLYRDRWSGDDALAIYIDTFNDNQNAKWFGITPAGMRFDVLLSDDGNVLNDSWNTFWDADSRITAEGWFTEVRIPFSSLGFKVVEGNAVMGLTATRLISRSNERVTFPAIDPQKQFRQSSVMQDVLLTGVHSAKPVYITPYALSGFSQRPVLTPTAAAFNNDRETAREIGLDLRYALTSQLTLDVTTNTDFAQVEADDQQVNLDRFSLFFPEKRRFFQEGSGIFDYVIGGSRLFHSRNIGLTSSAVPVPVLGGARIVGRAGSWDIGALAMRTDEIDNVSGESFGVVRLRRPVLNANSTAGFMMTSRTGGGAENYGVGMDASLRVKGNDYLTVKLGSTFDDAAPDDADIISRSTVLVDLTRRVARGLAYTLSFNRANEDYRPDLGFLPRRDFTTANAIANWFIFTDASPRFRRVYPGALAFSTFRNSDGKLESGQYAAWVQWDTKAGGGGWVEPKVFRENVLTPFTLGGTATIPAGEYTFADLQVALMMPAGARVRTSIDARAGTYFDGTRAQVILSPTWNVSKYLELGGQYQMSLLRFPDRDQSADIHVARLRVGTALNARASGNAFVQYNSTTDRLGVNLRLRYSFAEGTDLWLVYDEGIATERPWDGIGPRMPVSQSRSVIVKYSHTLQF